MDSKPEFSIFQNFVEMSSVGHGLARLDGTIVYVNLAFCNILGEKYREDAIGKKVETYFPKEVREKLINEILPAVRREGHWSGELLFQTVQGRLVPAIQNISLIKDDEGNPRYFSNVVTDITERKGFEKELKREKEIAEKYLNMVRVMIVGLNAEKKVILINERGCEILGYPRQDILGKNWFDHFLPVRLRKDVNAVADALFKGDIKPVEYYENSVLTKSGEERMIAWHNIVVQDEQGKISSILSSGEDITERKKAEQRLLMERDFSDAILNSLPGVFYMFNKEMKILRWNKNFEKITEYSCDEISRMSPLDFFEGQDKTLIEERTREVFTKGISDAQAQLKTKSGKKIPYYFSGQMVVIEGETCLIGTGIDITEQKKAEEGLRYAMKEKETLLQEVHHRVKNNLLTLYSLVNLQRESLREGLSAEMALDDTKQRISAMGRVHRMLYSTKNFSEIDFSEYIRLLMDDVKATCGTSKCRVKIESDLDSIMLDIDRAVPCGLIVNELLVNSFRHAFSGRASGCIGISLKKKGANIELKIKDDGAGIPFHPLSKESKTLGLRLVSMLSQQLKADVSYKGGQGSLFTITLRGDTI
ncbi:MAG: PAS domain S-box protein [Candidatus Omnitrophica bacterium]|nr:PAS domain S-box protein [Candidatus Omnitrophota bacterium]